MPCLQLWPYLHFQLQLIKCKMVQRKVYTGYYGESPYSVTCWLLSTTSYLAEISPHYARSFLGMMDSMRAYPTLMTIIGALSTVTTAVYTAFSVYSLWTGALLALLISFMLIAEISKKHQKSAASEWRDKYSKQPDKSTSESFLPSEQAFSRPADQVNTMWHHLLLCICYTMNVLAPHP